MCETDVYLIDADGEKLFAKEIASMSPKQKGYIFVDIYGRRYEVDDVEIVYIDFIGHKVVLRRS
uniref:CooT family nickel-binding protein n=3 Tax=Thermofilum pendens TaxID=2269 RepID=A0A7J3X9M8_THEPE